MHVHFKTFYQRASKQKKRYVLDEEKCAELESPLRASLLEGE